MIDILAGLGFSDVVKPGMLNTAGRFMTIPKGAKLKGIALEQVNEKLAEQGFITGYYSAVRDQNGEYLGTVEVTQKIKPIQEISGEKRLVSD